MANHRAASSASPLRVRHQPDSHSPGVLAPEGPSTPASTSARQERIYPDLSRPDTPRRSPTPFVPWKKATKSNRTEHGTPLGEPTSQATGRKPVDPLGPPLNTARESDAERPHPRCLPPPAQTCHSLECSTGQLWSSRRWSVAHGTFGTSSTQVLTRPALRWLSRGEHG